MRGAKADITQESSTPDYSMGYEEAIEQIVSSRTAATHAAYLLPHLKPGLRMLDIGCGPGTISVGLAKAVHPGEFIGVDMEESQVELSTKVAREGGNANARFQVADALNLPFPNDHFEVVHLHAVLMHIPGTMPALSEIQRVLKPGGILGVRDSIMDMSFIAPDIGNLNRFFPIFATVVAANGGHPQMGKDHRALLSGSGFVDIESTGSFDSWGSAETVPVVPHFINGLPFADQAISQGITTREELDALRKNAIAWQDHPGAFTAMAFGEVVAHKP